MKTKSLFAFGFLILHSVFGLSARAQGTAFTYQGRLDNNGSPANGRYDLLFTIHASATGTNDAFANQTNSASLSNGLFTVTLDFGAGVFDGAARWLDISFRSNGSGGFIALSPRQFLSATPYAVLAGNVPTNTIGSPQLQDGAVTSSKIASGAVNASHLATWAVNWLNIFPGSVTSDAIASSAITEAKINPTTTWPGFLKSLSVGAAQIADNAVNSRRILDDSITSADVVSNTFWQTTGNSGTAVTNFLGTTDNQPLELKVNGMRALRLEPIANDVFHSNTVNVVGGSSVNSVGAGVSGATIGGGGALSYFGTPCTNRVEADFGTVSGGGRNTIQPNTVSATIGGGFQNTIHFFASEAIIGGGYGNTIQTDANLATIGGGFQNIIQPYASYATIGGGSLNTIQTNASYATIPGGRENSATSYAFAAGRRAKANHTGAFVWADSQNADFASTANNQFLVRASGGVGIGTTNPVRMLQIGDKNVLGSEGMIRLASRTSTGAGNNRTWEFGVPQTGDDLTGVGYSFVIRDADTALNRMVIRWDTGNVGIGNTNPANLLVVGGSGSPAYCNGTSWVNGSDRNSKESFAAINPRAVLEKVSALPITEWKYKVEADGTRHLGPMAQDFHTAFGLNGPDDKHIATVDADGVALAAIQGLNQKVEAGSQKLEDRSRKLEDRLQQKETEITGLKARLAKLEQLMNQKLNGDAQ